MNETLDQPRIGAASDSGLDQPDMGAMLKTDLAVRQAIQLCWEMLPETERSLQRVEEEIIQHVRQAIHGMAAKGAHRQPALPAQPTAYEARLSRVRATYPNAYQKWTTEEDQALELQYAAGTPIQMLARSLERQPSAIRSRLRKLGLITEEERGA